MASAEASFPHNPTSQALLGGQWVVIIGVISKVATVTTHLITTHEPLSNPKTSAPKH